MADTENFTGTSTTADQPTTVSYMILRRDGSGYWNEEGWTDARSAGAAIRKWLTKDDAQENAKAWLAVPERSWNPVTVEVKQMTTLNLKPAA